jgi:hypothetical protein
MIPRCVHPRPLAAVLATPLQAAYVAVFLVAAMACAASAVRARAVDEPDVARGLTGLLAVVTVWTAVTGVRLAVPAPDLGRALYIVELVAGFTAVVAWLYFTSAFAGRSSHRDPRYRAVAAVGCLTVVTVKLTNPIHGWYFDAAMVADPFLHLAIMQSWLHWLVTGIAYTGAGVGFYMLFDGLSTVERRPRSLWLLVAATLLPVAASFLALSTTTVPDANFESLGVAVFAVGALCFAEGEVRWGAATASRALLDELADPALVVDGDRAVQHNDAAARLWDGLDGEPLPVAAPALATALDEGARSLDAAGRTFDLQQRSVDLAGGRTGTGVLLRDVTEYERQRREIARQNDHLEDLAAATAHNLRNASNVLLGHLDVLAGAVPPESAASGEAAADGSGRDSSLAVSRRTAEHIAAVSEDLRLLAEFGQTVETTDPVDAADAATVAWRDCDTAGGTLDCEPVTVAADRRRLVALLTALFCFHLDNGADQVRLAPLGDGSGFRVSGDGDPLTGAEADAALSFDAESGHSPLGIGLPVARALAEAHGWHLEYDGDAPVPEFHVVTDS